ncbi:MAG TPA: hypothetical protein VM802_30735 [Chitinophaga sp.]|nr:hypothetical protein [Chitinophaga sp.]HVI49282.1 hypothetical protein [Chitinophaga sp.]
MRYAKWRYYICIYGQLAGFTAGGTGRLFTSFLILFIKTQTP